MVKDVLVLEEAVADLNEGRAFYDVQQKGVGDYFWDCLISDIDSLIIYAGIHRKTFGFHQMYSKRFPYTIYYDIIGNMAYVVAILPMRRDPAWILNQIKKRR
ncbi:MAG: type II toxin-antitoxin system RelE/ParE family toxin [Desulfobulbaceae bacterium]|nr:type II toxin-antitoxin system RelE/ParE family toxin [Desulfobulbaceae bacterium]